MTWESGSMRRHLTVIRTLSFEDPKLDWQAETNVVICTLSGDVNIFWQRLFKSHTLLCKNYVGLSSSLRIRRSKSPAFFDHPKRSWMVQCLNVSLLSKNKRSLMVQRLNVSLLSKSQDRLMVQHLKWPFVQYKHILQKKGQKQLNQTRCSEWTK